MNRDQKPNWQETVSGLGGRIWGAGVVLFCFLLIRLLNMLNVISVCKAFGILLSSFS